MLNFKALDHINMTVKNLDSSVSYYQKIFNFNFKIKEEGDYNGNPYKIIGVSNKVMLCIYQSKEKEEFKIQNNNVGHFGFHVHFYDEIIEDLEAAGANVRNYDGRKIIQYPHSKSIYINDPDGNQIELSEVFAGGL